MFTDPIVSSTGLWHPDTGITQLHGGGACGAVSLARYRNRQTVLHRGLFEQSFESRVVSFNRFDLAIQTGDTNDPPAALEKGTQIDFIIICATITHMNPGGPLRMTSNLINQFPLHHGFALRISSSGILMNSFSALGAAIKQFLSRQACDLPREGIPHEATVQEEAAMAFLIANRS